MPSQLQIQVPELAITPADDASDNNSAHSSTSSGNTFHDRRPSDSNTIVGSQSLLPTNSSSFLDAREPESSSRSRSSSVAGSMLSGETAHTDSSYVAEMKKHPKGALDEGLEINSDLPPPLRLPTPPPEFPTTEKSGDEEEDADPLRPDPGTESAFAIENNVFGFMPGHLTKLFNPKSLPAYKALGGIHGIAAGLQTDIHAGLSSDEAGARDRISFETAVAVGERAVHKDAPAPGPAAVGETPATQTTRMSSDYTKPPAADSDAFSDRKRVFGTNTLPTKAAKSLFRLMWEQYNDKILILLTVAAVVSLALGLYETLGMKPEIHYDENGNVLPEEAKVNWIEGVAICVAIIIVVSVGSLNDWQKERQFVKLNAKKDDRVVRAIRSGKSLELSVHDILVGDVLHIEPGDMIPADGIFIQGHNVKCDESSATGESDQMKKTAGDEVYRRLILSPSEKSKNLDCFIISGSKVLEGTGTYLVTATGVNSSFGKLMVSLHTETEMTPLQAKLAGLADGIAYFGGGAALLLFAVLFFRFCAGLPGNTASAAEKGSEFVDILIVAITLVVVAIPEGLPLAVTLALAFATTRMLKDNNLVRVLRACETMGNATTVCSDKTGTLTQNEMTVVAGTISTDAEFSSVDEDVLPPQKVMAGLSKDAQDLILSSIVLNTTAFEGEQDGKMTFIGSKTETAMLSFARSYLGMGMIQPERDAADIIQMFPFDSAQKCMGVVVRLPSSGIYRLLIKGASEILLSKCTHRIDLSSGTITPTPLSTPEISLLESRISSYATRSLRTIAMTYRDFTQWPPVEAETDPSDPNSVIFRSLFKCQTFLGLVGIQDPLRPGVSQAVQDCQRAGVVVRMVTGDNVLTATSIARDAGILTDDGIVMEGPKFRHLSAEEMDAILPKLQVLARSSPEDKRILVSRLKALGETVAVTGDGTNDGPALKTADIGFSMGIAGTEVAKEASSIILMDDNFASIIKALMWGRAVNDAVQKFLQFQLTVNITAVLLTFVSAVASKNMESVLTAVQLLWVNLIMDTFAALALATDAPTPEILNRPPKRKSAPLISANMWKMIIGQAIFQVIVTFVMHFGGTNLFPKSWADDIDTIVFNTFVWMQIFNEFNNRRLDNKFNIFEGVLKNWFFIGINCVMVGGQVLIIFVGSTAFGIKDGGIGGKQWAVCVGVAAISLPWAVLVRCVPDEAVIRFWKATGAPVMDGCKRVWKSVSALFGRKKKNSNEETSDEEAIREETEKP